MTCEDKKNITCRDRFGWFWYNDEEIFHDSEEDIFRKMQIMHDQGITHVITFSCTHFRMGFEPWWDKIDACLRKVVKAAHALGIKVIEHHSSHLMYYPSTPELIARLTRDAKIRRQSLDNYPGLVEYLLNPDEAEKRTWQINGSTGEPVTPYAAHGHCFNNDEYVEKYLKYLETVYATGVDGIMTDDVQYYGLGQACACKVCRKKFFEETGYILPEPGEAWNKWFGDMRNESFNAWVHYRKQVMMNFHQRVAEHYHKLGLELIRPNYTSGALRVILSGLEIGELPELDVYFQECCYSSIIRYSFLSFLDEQLQRALVAGQRNIPHMMMFYADRNDQLIFSWAVARLAGAMFTNTPEGGSQPDEKSLRDFENRYQSDLFNLQVQAQIGFVDSRENCAFGPSYDMSRMRIWMQSCRLNNIQHKLLDVRDPASWDVPILILNEVGLLRDSEISALLDYVKQGNTLVVSGSNGVVDTDYHPRTTAEQELLECKNLDGNAVEIIDFGAGKLIKVGYAFGYPGSDEYKKALFVDNPKRFAYLSIIDHIKELAHIADSFDDRKNPSAADPGRVYNAAQKPFRQVAELLQSLLKKPAVAIKGLPDGVLYTVFADNNGDLSIQMLNAAGCFDGVAGKIVSHKDPIPFPQHSGKAEIVLNRAYANAEVKLVTFDGEELLAFAHNSNCLGLELEKIKTYAMLKIKK